MEFTGIAGSIMGFMVLVTAYAIVIAGLFTVWSHVIIEILLRKVLTWFRIYMTLLKFIYYKREFSEWLKEKEKEC